MAGMQTQVNLIANCRGVFDGLSGNFSGPGFPDMQFKTHATSRDEFDAWVKKAQTSPEKLGIDSYRELSKPTEKARVPVLLFRRAASLSGRAGQIHGQGNRPEAGRQVLPAQGCGQASE
jgi:cytochrome o ubiquinol oxidase subunit 2